MEPEYLDKVHGIMQGVYGDKFTLDVDTFKDKMINETQYRDKIYGIMQGVYGDKFTLDPKTFYNKVLESSKKKSQSEIGSQATQLGGGSENAQYAFEPGMQEKPTFQGVGKAVEKNLGVTKKVEPEIPYKQGVSLQDETLLPSTRMKKYYESKKETEELTPEELSKLSPEELIQYNLGVTEKAKMPNKLQKEIELEDKGLLDVSKLSDAEKEKYKSKIESERKLDRITSAEELAGYDDANLLLNYYNDNIDKIKSDSSYTSKLNAVSNFKKELEKKYGANFDVTMLSPQDADIYNQLSNMVVSSEDQILNDYINALRKDPKYKEKVEKYDKYSKVLNSIPDSEKYTFIDNNGILRKGIKEGSKTQKEKTKSGSYITPSYDDNIKSENTYSNQEIVEKERFIRDLENDAIKFRSKSKKLGIPQVKYNKPFNNYFADVQPIYGDLNDIYNKIETLKSDVSSGKITDRAKAESEYANLIDQFKQKEQSAKTIRESYNISEDDLRSYNNLLDEEVEKYNLLESNFRKRPLLEETDYSAKLKSEKRYAEMQEGNTMATALIAVENLGYSAANQLVFESLKSFKPIGESMNMGQEDYDWSDKLYDYISATQKASFANLGYKKPQNLGDENMPIYTDYQSDLPGLFDSKEEAPLPLSAGIMLNLANGLGSAAAFMTPMGVASKAIKGAGMASKVGRQILTKGSWFLQMESANYERNLNAGMNPDDASELSILQTIQDIAAESIFNEAAIFTKARPAGFVSALRAGATKREALKAGLRWASKASKDVAESSVKESFEEGMGQFSQDLGATEANLLYNTGMDKFNDAFKAKSYANSMAVGALVGGFLSGLNSSIPMSPTKMNAMSFMGTNAKEILDQLAILQNKGEIDQKKYDLIKSQLESLSKSSEVAQNTPGFSELSKADQDALIATIHQRNQVSQNVKDIGFETKQAKSMMNILNQRIQNIVDGKRSTDEGSPIFRTYMDANLANMGVAVVDINEDGSFNLMVAPGLSEQEKNDIVKNATKYLSDKIKNDAIVAAKFKPKPNAVQESSTEEVLPREQGTASETGSQPQGMGQGVQGQEAPQEGQEVSQEDVEAKKADIEKRRQAELSEYTEEQLNEAYTVGSTDTIRDRINEKYDLEIDQQIQSQEAQKVSQDNIEDPKADIERRRQEELDSESGRIVESTEIWKDGEGRLYRIDKLKNGKQRLAVTNEEGKLLNVIDTYEGSVSPTLFIADGQKVKDQEVRENKIADKINAKYDAELAALESGNQSTQEGVEQQKAPEVQPTEQVAEQPTPQVQEEKQPFTGRSNQDRSLKEKYKADNLKRKILDQAQRIASALGNNTQVYIHETTDEYNKAIAERLGEDQKESTNGRFLYGDGVSEIHIDLSKANQNTLPHEAVHAVLYKAFGENEKLFQQFKDKLKPLLANSTVAELENFANQEIYVKQGVTSEEFLAELGGVMTAAGNRIPKTTLQKITQLLNEFLSKITGGRIAPLSTGEVIDLFNSMADAFASGQSIQSLMDSKGLVGSGKVNGNVKSKQSINTKLPEQQERTSNFSKVKEIKLSELNDKTGVLTGSDRLTTAVLKFPDGSTMVLKGGIFYPSETGLVWASTDISGATQLANKINEVIKQQGEAWLFPVNNSYGSQYSNYTFFEVGMRHLQYAVKTKAVNKDEIINKINQFKNRKNYLKSFKKDYKPKAFTQSLANKNLQQIYDLIHEDFIPENATYDGRKEFVKTFFGGKDTKSRVFKNVPNTSELIAMTTEPVNADVRDFTTSSVIKITGKVTPRETSKENDGELFHSSYPAILESSGNVESYVLDGTYNIEEVFPEFKNAAGKVVNWESVKKKIAKTGEDATYQNYKNTIISSQGAIPRAAKIKSKSQAPNLVEKAGISSNMTEDDQGNYLFYHYSPNKISSIDPRYFGRNVNRTGRDERPGMNISMYYTNPEVKDVSGDFGYVVRIPKDKVYPFNKDPLDLYDKAKEAFNKKFPGQAFDPNKQVAFISAEAAKLGYPMTVAKWGDNLRAQTTQKMVGEFYTKPAKGGGIDVNEDIAQFKVNKKARRSKLKSKSQIEVDPKQIQANSESKLNEVVNGDPESGATFNLDGTTYDGGGLVIPITSVNIDTDKISPKDISDMVEDNIDKIFDDQKVKTGIYKFTDGKQMSVDLNIIVPSEQVEFAKEFARAAGQESIFSLDTYENIKTGSTGENPVSFSAEEFLEIAEALNEGRLPNIERLEYKPEFKSKSQVSAIPKASSESKSVVSELETASNKTGLAKENAVKRFIEKYGEKGVVAKQISDNFDKIQEQLGITKICNI
jgi:hypothetical protein